MSAEEYNRLVAKEAKARGPQPEAHIKQQEKAWLRLHGWLVIPIFQGAKGLPATVCKGISDFIILRAGQVIFLEVKTEKGRQSENQRNFQADVESHGCVYRISRGIEDLGDLS